jgi:hypothetical protein
VGKRGGQGLGKSGRRVKGWVKIGGQESKGGEKGRASVRERGRARGGTYSSMNR